MSTAVPSSYIDPTRPFRLQKWRLFNGLLGLAALCLCFVSLVFADTLVFPHRHRQLWQHPRGRDGRAFRTTRRYHSSQNYDIGENLARGATGDAYGLIGATA